MFELAERLGMTVGQLEDRMPASELAEWMGLWRLRDAERERAERRQGVRRVR